VRVYQFRHTGIRRFLYIPLALASIAGLTLPPLVPAKAD
jgi:hypothetical protein